MCQIMCVYLWLSCHTVGAQAVIAVSCFALYLVCCWHPDDDVRSETRERSARHCTWSAGWVGGLHGTAAPRGLCWTAERNTRRFKKQQQDRGMMTISMSFSSITRCALRRPLPVTWLWGTGAAPIAGGLLWRTVSLYMWVTLLSMVKKKVKKRTFFQFTSLMLVLNLLFGTGCLLGLWTGCSFLSETVKMTLNVSWTLETHWAVYSTWPKLDQIQRCTSLGP